MSGKARGKVHGLLVRAAAFALVGAVALAGCGQAAEEPASQADDVVTIGGVDTPGPDSERGATAGEISTAEADAMKDEAAQWLVSVGQTAPDFTLEDASGQTHTLSSYRGRPVLLTFWTTWCPDCAEVMPILDEIFEGSGANQGDVVLLSVVNPQVDGYEDNVDVSLSEVRAHLETEGYAQPVLLDMTGDAFINYGITFYPTLYAIDADGKVEAVQVEPAGAEELFDLIDYVFPEE